MPRNSFATPITAKEWAIIILSTPLIVVLVLIPALIVYGYNRAVYGKEWPWRAR